MLDVGLGWNSDLEKVPSLLYIYIGYGTLDAGFGLLHAGLGQNWRRTSCLQTARPLYLALLQLMIILRYPNLLSYVNPCH